MLLVNSSLNGIVVAFQESEDRGELKKGHERMICAPCSLGVAKSPRLWL